MKKLVTCLALIFTGFAANVFAYFPYGFTRTHVSIPKYCGGLTFSIYGLYWRPTVPYLDYALIYDNVDRTGRSVFSSGGEYISQNPSYNWGFRANIGYVFPCTGNDVLVSFTNYDHDFKELIGNPTSGLSSFMTLASGDIASNNLGFPFPVVFEFLLNPVIEIVDASTLALDLSEAKSDFAYQAWDLEFGQSIVVGCDIRFRWFGGIRYASIEHQFLVDYTAVSTDTFEDVPGVGDALTVNFNAELIVNEKSNFHGVGPRFGMDASYDIGGCFGLSAQVSSSVIIGQINSSLHENFDRIISASIIPAPGSTTTFAETQVISASELVNFNNPNVTKIVPNLEARMGVNYIYIPCRNYRTKLTIEAGWAVTHYWNAVERITAISGNSPEMRGRQNIDASFEGPYLGIQVNV